jgi:hypothetical protein
MTGISAEFDSSDGLDDIMASNEEIKMSALAEFLATPGVAGSALEVEIREALSLGQEDAVESLSYEDISTTVYNVFHPRREYVVDRQQHRLPFEAFRLHVPPATGAQVKLTLSREETRSGSAEFKIASIGGGREWTLKIIEEISRTAVSSEQINVAALGIFDIIEYRRSSRVLAKYPRLAGVDQTNLAWDFVQLGAPDMQSRPNPLRPNPLKVREFDLRAVNSGVTDVAVTVEAGTSWDVSVGFTIANIGADLTATATGSYVRSISLACSLPDGHYYRAQQFPNTPGYIWTLDDAHTEGLT